MTAIDDDKVYIAHTNDLLDRLDIPRTKGLAELSIYGRVFIMADNLAALRAERDSDKKMLAEDGLVFLQCFRLLGMDASGASTKDIPAMIAALRAELDEMRETSPYEFEWMEKHNDEVKQLRAELERERIRLAACGVVALSNTPESAAEARKMKDEYWTASCSDVARMVDKNMQLRAELDEAKRLLRKHTSDNESSAFLARYRPAEKEQE